MRSTESPCGVGRAGGDWALSMGGLSQSPHAGDDVLSGLQVPTRPVGCKELRRTPLHPLRDAGLLALKYPETEKHQHQAYLSMTDDKKEPGREA